jgi:parallel beta-helix repeat protein
MSNFRNSVKALLQLAVCLPAVTIMASIFPVNAPAIAQVENDPPVIFFVSPTIGNDQTGNGSTQAPFRTISHVLSLVTESTNVIIQLSSGTYGTASGEIFPLRLKPGIILRGNEAQRGSGIAIAGGGNYVSPTFSSQNIAILGADRSELRGITISNPSPNGYGLWLESTSPIVVNNTLTGSNQDGIFVTGNSTALITKNIFVTNGASGISIAGISSPEVRDNIFNRTGFGININQNATPSLIGNIISGNQDGVVAQADSKPLLRGNVIEKNLRNGLTISNNGFPDLGNASDLGANIFQSNAQNDIQNQTSNPISSVGNQVAPEKISGNVQLISSQPVVSKNNNAIAKNFAPPSSNFSQLSNSNNFVKNLQRESGLTPATFKIEPIPNSVIVKITPAASNRVIPSNPFIVPELPPITFKPPSGESVNQPIIIAPPSKTAIDSVNSNSPTDLNPPRYRVIVPIFSKSNSKLNLQQVRRIFPNAFPSTYRGQKVWQIGAYSDRAIANAQIKKLSQAGFVATIVALNP